MSVGPVRGFRWAASGVYHVGQENPVGCQQLPDDSWLAAPGNPPLAIGLFEDTGGSTHVLVMNRNSMRAETATLRFPPNVTAVSRTESTTGKVEELRLHGHTCRVTIPAGSGLLLSMR